MIQFFFVKLKSNYYQDERNGFFGVLKVAEHIFLQNSDEFLIVIKKV
jgi:hypothetical protein